ncbi:hypothetical protein [Geodermatophilus obscurus]|uniref:hypothetical protein n=1 Tax=Geodermatophilus obscurus TaxID=1861 RepID=UPI00059E2446|nr:hypothetical protein [Geodermatophilus obscurus]
MSVAASRWVFRHIADYGIRPDEDRADFGPYRLALLLADYTNPKDPGEGAWPSRDTLAVDLRTTPRTVTRWLARLIAAGVVEVHEQEAPPTGRRGRRSHRYLLPGFLAAELLDKPSVSVSRNSSDLEDTLRGNVSRNSADLRDTDAKLRDTDGGIARHGHAHDDPRGRYLEVKEGKDPLPPTPWFPRQCSQHQDAENDRPCVPCKRARQDHDAAADEKLTRQQVEDILGVDYWQPPPPPANIWDDDRASQAWAREQVEAHRADRMRQAKLRLSKSETGGPAVDVTRLPAPASTGGREQTPPPPHSSVTA